MRMYVSSCPSLVQSLPQSQPTQHIPQLCLASLPRTPHKRAERQQRRQKRRKWVRKRRHHGNKKERKKSKTHTSHTLNNNPTNKPTSTNYHSHPQQPSYHTIQSKQTGLIILSISVVLDEQLLNLILQPINLLLDSTLFIGQYTTSNDTSTDPTRSTQRCTTRYKHIRHILILT